MTTTPERRARVSEYVPWMLRDYATNQGPSTTIVILLLGFLTVLPVMQGAATAGVRPELGAIPLDVATRLLHSVIPPLIFLGTFFATNGIVANDRKLGYYRFLFAKPVSPPVYYAATFASYGVGLIAVTVVLMGVWAVSVRPMFPVELLGVVLLMYLAYGGLGFLLSAAWRFDWISLVTVMVLANVGWTVWGQAEGLRHWILYLLPPVHRANDVYGLVAREVAGTMPWRSIVWLGGYGLACFAVGLFVIRRRPLGTS